MTSFGSHHIVSPHLPSSDVRVLWKATKEVIVLAIPFCYLPEVVVQEVRLAAIYYQLIL